MLLIATAIALVPCALVFLAVLEGDWMTGFFKSVADGMFRQPVWAILAATSPLAGALLVGYGYMQRGIQRRAAEREAAVAAAPAPRTEH
jgi:succinate dehydrogenase hydrophobic anchor subunit